MIEVELPEACAVGFKEWEGVCDALGEGRQIVILRKGGVDEGPGGFTPRHPFFWLYPTRVHEAQQGLRVGRDPTDSAAAPAAGAVALRGFAAVDAVRRLESEAALEALEEFHIWTGETVLKRFRYRAPGLWALVVRVFAQDQPTNLIATPEQRGCTTWVELDPPPPTAGLAPVLDDFAWESRRAALLAVLG